MFVYSPYLRFLRAPSWVRYGENETWRFSVTSLPQRGLLRLARGCRGFQWEWWKLSPPSIAIHKNPNVYTELWENLWVQKYRKNREATKSTSDSRELITVEQRFRVQKKPCHISIFCHTIWKLIGGWRLEFHLNKFSLWECNIGTGKGGFCVNIVE